MPSRTGAGRSRRWRTRSRRRRRRRGYACRSTRRPKRSATSRTQPASTWPPRNACEQTRLGWGLLIAMAAGEAEPVFEVVDRDADGVPVRVYRPAPDADLPVLVLFHGGGWVIGSVEEFDVIARQVANASGAIVVSVDYRLAPGAPVSGSARRLLARARVDRGARRRDRRGPVADRGRRRQRRRQPRGRVRAPSPRSRRTRARAPDVGLPGLRLPLRHRVVRRATARATSSRPSRCAGSSIATPVGRPIPPR